MQAFPRKLIKILFFFLNFVLYSLVSCTEYKNVNKKAADTNSLEPNFSFRINIQNQSVTSTFRINKKNMRMTINNLNKHSFTGECNTICFTSFMMQVIQV